MAQAPAEIADIAARLLAVVEAVDGRNLGTNGEVLWLESTRAPGLQLRLSGPGEARCYDRSANFAIAYSGTAAAGDLAPVRALADAVKRVDATPIAGAAEHFRAAATWLSARAGGAVPGATPRWERDSARRLNVVFLDLAAQLFGTPGDPLAPLHWGYWPVGEPAGDGHDPQRAFSDVLLAHVPAGTGRVLDVGCGLGFNARLLAERGHRVTAVSPVAHHCALIDRAGLPGVEVRCARFDELPLDPSYDLLLFSESLNHFPLDDAFLQRCRGFLAAGGHVLMADDLTEERVRQVESQRVFRILTTVDITANVAPTTEQWGRQLPAVAAYHAALMSILELTDPALAARVREVLADVDNPELRNLFAGRLTAPEPKGRYMIYLLAPAA